MVPVGAIDEQVRVAQAVRADALLQRLRQARGEVAAAEVQVGIEERERAALARQLDRRVVGGVAHRLGDAAPPSRARRRAVVAQAEHHQRVAEAGEAEADAALVVRLGLLLRQRPDGDVEHVVEHAHGDRATSAKAAASKLASAANGARTKRVRSIEPRQQQP